MSCACRRADDGPIFNPRWSIACGPVTRLLVNCRKLPFRSTLGVGHVLLKLCEELSSDFEIDLVVMDRGELESSPAWSTIEAFATHVWTIEEARDRRSWLGSHAIEVLPHHFQPSEYCSRSIVLCHDLHVFDIPWKYGDRVNSMQAEFRRVLEQASAVVTHFPRTYFDVERVAGLELTNLFLTPSPLMLDTRITPGAFAARAGSNVTRLLYPAQLQAHKNHVALVPALQEVRSRGKEVVVVCPGSDFDAGLSASLFQSIEAAGVTDSFEFRGRVSNEELVALYADCDGVIVPSVAEGGAYIALEAIAAGQPVAVNSIASARAHAAAMACDVFWFDADDPNSVVDALYGLIEMDRAANWEANTRCRELIDAATWTSVADIWRSVIHMVTGGGRRPTLRLDRRASVRSYTRYRDLNE